MTSAADGVIFDMAASGQPSRFSWTAAAHDDAWLALDRNGNGRIDNGMELFSNFTPQPEKPTEKNGFEALAIHDQVTNGGNGDGWINENDSVFRQLLGWQDRNHNGVSEPEELKPLSTLGITAISLDYKPSHWTDVYGNEFRFRAKVLRTQHGGGNHKWAYDVFLVEGL